MEYGGRENSRQLKEIVKEIDDDHNGNDKNGM